MSEYTSVEISAVSPTFLKKFGVIRLSCNFSSCDSLFALISLISVLPLFDYLEVAGIA